MRPVAVANMAHERKATTSRMPCSTPVATTWKVGLSRLKTRFSVSQHMTVRTCFSGRVRRTELTLPEWRERDIHTLAELNSTGTVHAF